MLTNAFQPHIVSPQEARDFVYESILNLINLYENGAITFGDVYYRVMAEPLLTVNEKHDIISSPTVETVLRLWKGQMPAYQINGVAIPGDAVVVTESRAMMWKLINRYPFLRPVTAKLVAFGVMTSLKCISSLVKGMRRPIVIPDLPWKHQDALATIVVMARLANMRLITNMPLLLVEEVKAYETYNPRLLTLGDLDVTVVRVSVKDITKRFEPALKKFIEDRGLAGVAKTLYGIDTEKLAWREDWWNYLDFKPDVDEDRFRRAFSCGLPSRLAKKVASWRVRNLADVVKLARELRMEIQDNQYFKRVLEFLSSEFNVPVDVLETLLYANDFRVVEETVVGRDGKVRKQSKVVTDTGVIYLGGD